MPRSAVLTRRGRYGYLIGGWAVILFGFVSYPVPLYPSTVTIVVGLLMVARVQPWARRLILVTRRRVRPFNRLYLDGQRRLRARRAESDLAAETSAAI